METGGIQFQIRQPSVRIMGWSCMQCTFSNANDAAANCGACSAIHVLQCPACKGEINNPKLHSRYGKRLHVNGKTYHPDCFCCSGCNKPLQSRFQVVNGGNYHPECAPKPKTIISTTTTTSRSTDARDKSNHSNIKANGSASSHGTGWYCPTCTFFNANDAAPTCGACEAIRIMVCPGCNGEIKYGPRTNVNGQAYHPDCFRCAACHRKFTTSQFQVKDGAYYDQACYKQLFHPRKKRLFCTALTLEDRCDVCEDFIPHQPGTQKIAFKVCLSIRFSTKIESSQGIGGILADHAVLGSEILRRA
ncbi:hypothetical protein PsorP6_011199 [Peronosclerospora sorghi]|uniref:Uncharacterized protein n=1 Tax=Peronosclerospora sorghi TaxID=230839 RepID=A0ACC0VV03_9STRA|nr:hypothetical protein PsorP6_011199 [Peronosclerospora sorghi]